MTNKNYQEVMEEILEEVKILKKHPTLLLHSCCAPCSSYVLEYLSKYFDITILYYNPNIYPEEEYIRRRDELYHFLKDVPYNISVIEIPYNEQDFYQEIKGFEHSLEKGERCFICYELRLRETVKYAKKHGFNYFTTTLSISPYKVSSKINEIGQKLEKEYGVSFLYADFKKKNGYQRSLELSSIYNLYRQNYCGCVYSYTERMKYENKIGSGR